MIYVDIHTHRLTSENDVVSVYNLSPKETVAAERSTFYSTGIHPWEIDGLSTDSIFLLEKNLDDDRVKFIGECGFDKNISTSYEQQLHYFSLQVEFSEQKQKPLIIHCVGYFNELIRLRNNRKPSQPWIIHGFRGKPSLASQLLKAGFDLSFGEKFNAQSVLITPLEHLFVETDESLLSIKEIYHNISLVKKCDFSELAAGVDLLSVKTHFKLL